MACDWHNHNFINLESLTVTYSEKFCFDIVKFFLDPITDKYLEIMKMLMLLDEWVFFTTGKRLMASATDRAIYKKYIIITQRCVSDPNKLANCMDFCREFNVNKFSYMFDGELKPIDNYLDNFTKFFDQFKSDAKDLFQNK